MHMHKRIVLFDVDGTIIDREYKLTIAEDIFLQHVRRAESAGVLLGLSSDTPWYTLRRLAERLTFNGPIVAEKGGVVDLRGESSLPHFTLSEAEQFGSLHAKVVTALAEVDSGRWILGSGDVIDFQRWIKKLPSGQPGDVAVFTNPHRLTSFSCWTRGWIDGEWRRDASTMNRVFSSIAREGGNLGQLWDERDLDLNPHYGTIIIHHRRMRKVLALPLIRDAYPGVPITMVGDGQSDWLDDPDVEQMAVGNAVVEYRKHCSWTAPSPVTAGVVEVLSEVLAKI